MKIMPDLRGGPAVVGRQARSCRQEIRPDAAGGNNGRRARGCRLKANHVRARRVIRVPQWEHPVLFLRGHIYEILGSLA